MTAISTVSTCSPGETLTLSRPEAPPADLQDFMVSALIPDGLELSIDDINVALYPAKPKADPYVGQPAAALSIARRRTFFFLRQPAGRPIKVEFRHPQLRTREVLLSPLGGGVRELEDVRLQERVALEVTLDYRPTREHRSQTLQALLCGQQQRRFFEEVPREVCSRTGSRVGLQPGQAIYRLEGLDSGWYVLEASIDNELIFGLGSQASALVDAEAPAVLPMVVEPLEELHIFGSLLVGGEPVPGAVVLSPFMDGITEALIFPTDDELLYHMYFFAQTPSEFGRNRLPEDLRGAESEKLRGLFDGYQLQGCTEDGFCHLFHHQSTFSGGGRMDLDLGEDRELLARVVDTSSGSPIAGALVVVGKRGKAAETIHFVAGELHRQEATFEAPSTLTDADGYVRLRGLPAGQQRIGSSADGYQPKSREFSMPESGRLELELALSSEKKRRDDPSALTLRFPDRGSVARAFFLALRAGQEVDYRCSQGTDLRGQVRFPDTCLED
ncbi:MAG: carboxypeptidase regulatory-like domain-containing protein, partial [Acidobacteria bacterium]|nr:carboxypeptidase regulatory-like domain-containing protein [Acidobacteriota bacterium]